MIDAILIEKSGIVEEKGSAPGTAPVTFGTLVVLEIDPFLVFVADNHFSCGSGKESSGPAS